MNQKVKEMFEKIDHTCLTVSDMDRSIAFYRDIVGMRLAFDSKAAGIEFSGPEADRVMGCPSEGQRVVFMTLGDSRLQLVQFFPGGKPLVDNRASDIGSVHLCFKTEDIHMVYEKFTSLGVTFHCPPQHIGPGWVTYLRDPDGIILELAQDDG